jgi:hypothetical protein
VVHGKTKILFFDENTDCNGSCAFSIGSHTHHEFASIVDAEDSNCGWMYPFGHCISMDSHLQKKNVRIEH